MSLRIIKFAGIMFMFITSIMFYIHMYTAFSNPDFSVHIYFNHFGEGMFELLFFSMVFPLILFAFSYEYATTWRIKK